MAVLTQRSNPHKDLWLHPEAGEDGIVVLRDQFGRELRGVRHLDVHASYQDVTEVTVTFLAGVDGPMINRTKRK